MGFAGGHLNALDYMWAKYALRTHEDYQIGWKIYMPEGKANILVTLS